MSAYRNRQRMSIRTYFSCNRGCRNGFTSWEKATGRPARPTAVVSWLQALPRRSRLGVRELVAAFPRATVVSAVLLLTTYLARSLYAEPFHEHLSRATAVSAVLFLTTYLARSLYAEPFREHLPVPLPSRQCPFSRRTLLVPFSLNHSANSRLPHRNRQAKPPMECGNLLPLSGLQPPASTPVRASPLSQLRSAISDTLRPHARNRNRLCISLCFLCFLLFILFFVFVLVSIVTQLRRQEPRKTRNTRKVGKNDDPGLPVGRLRFPPVVLPPPARFRRRRSAPYGHPAPWPRHIPRAFPRCFAQGDNIWSWVQTAAK